MWCVFISLHSLGTSNEHLLKFPVGKGQHGTFPQEMLMLYDLLTRGMQIALEISTKKCHLCHKFKELVHSNSPVMGHLQLWVYIERTRAEHLGLSCCYPTHQPHSSPTPSSFTLKISPSALTYGTCEERIKFPQPLNASYDYSGFLIVKLVIFCFVDQNSSPTTSSNIFFPLLHEFNHF